MSKIEEFCKEKIIEKKLLEESVNVEFEKEYMKWHKKKYGEEIEIGEDKIKKYITKKYGKIEMVLYKCDEDEEMERKKCILTEYTEKAIEEIRYLYNTAYDKKKGLKIDDVYEDFRLWLTDFYPEVGGNKFSKKEVKRYMVDKYGEEVKGIGFVGISLSRYDDDI